MFLAVTAYLAVGHCQAKKRAKKGLAPTRYDGVKYHGTQTEELKLMLCSISFGLRMLYTLDHGCRATSLSIAHQTTRTKIWKVAHLQVSDARWVEPASPSNNLVYDANNAPPPTYQPRAARKENPVPSYTVTPSPVRTGHSPPQELQNTATSAAPEATARSARSTWISKLMQRK